MRKLVLASMLSAAAAFSQSAETLYYLGDMRGANENPAVPTTSYGSAVLVAHIVKDAAGKVVSGTVDFNVTGQFSEAYTVTGLHIHSGAAGVNGPVTVDSGLSAANNLPVVAGRTLIQRSGQVNNAAAIATIEGMLANPGNYYVNLHTTVNPGGMFRGQLYLAERRSFMTSMNSANENPPIEGANTGLGSFHGFRALDANGNYVTGGGMFVVNYSIAPITANGTTTPQRMTGLHIHRGAVGINGPVVLDSTLSAATGFDTPANGVGTVTYVMAAPTDNAAAVSALNDMWDAPAGFYMNMHSTTYPGGIIRGQVRAAENFTTSVNMLSTNEVPPPAVEASAPAAVQIDMLRNAAGAVTHALVAYSVNHRFPGETTFTGLHIHDGAAGVNGPVRLDSGLSAANNVASATGAGNIYRVFNANNDAALAAVNSLLANPEGWYLNLHTTVSPGGAVRSQLAAPNTAKPSVVDFISGVSDPSLRVAAQGGLMTAFGENLFKVSSSLWGAEALPASVNGTSATIGGVAARVMAMGWSGGSPPQYLVLQVPFDAPQLAQDLIVTNSNGAGNTFKTNVTVVAPGLYFDTVGGIALRQDLTLVRPNTPAAAGEPIGLVATGLGVTNPALETGQFAPLAPATTVDRNITATIGGRAANVVTAVALPGYAGVYAVVVVVPAGLTPGAQPVQIQVHLPGSSLAGAGGVTVSSNTVGITVR
jgi:uncharacterized protein (TIGR03437 family)